MTVTLNNIPSSCSKRKCSFTFPSSVTPTLASISPQRGATGTEITLTGSGFSSSIQEVNVTISGTTCHVTSSNDTNIKCITGQSIGGLHEVVVKIGNKGFAKPSSGKISFTYEISVSGIKPSRGSIGGGTLVTISGSGFGVTPNDSSVTIGSSICDILNISMKQISCVTSPHGVSNASVNVVVGCEIGTTLIAFWYDSGMTPLVSSLSTLEGSVSGGDQLMIQGTGFGFQKGTVKIGPNPCKVTLYSDVLIKCTTPASAPGIYDVLVCVGGKGCAVDAGLRSRPPQFKYILEVTDISPGHGSIIGGSVLTLSGRGFSDNASAIAVTVGDVPCRVLSSRSTTIMCKTDASSVTYYVDNTEIHPGKERKFDFKPKYLGIFGAYAIIYTLCTLYWM